MSITIHTGDCLEGLAAVQTDSVDVCVTSPPYNLGIAYRSHDDARPREEYLAWCERWLRRVQRVLHARGSLFLNVAGKPTDPLVPHQVLQVARVAGFTLQNSILWVKSMSPDLEAAEPVEGHVKTLNSTRFLNDAWEYVFHLTPLGKTPIDKLAVGVRYADESNLKRGTRGKNGNARCAGNVWFIPYETIQRRDTDRPHPATFPVSLPERCLRLHGLKRARRVIDPFCGLGTTAVACHRLGLEFEGWELDAEYAALARERVAREAQAEAMVQTLLAFA